MEGRTDQGLVRLGRVALPGIDVGRVRQYLLLGQGTDRIAERVVLLAQLIEGRRADPRSLPSGQFGVVVEAAAGLAAQHSRVDQAQQQGWRRVAPFGEFLL